MFSPDRFQGMLVLLEMADNFQYVSFECSHSVYDPAAGTSHPLQRCWVLGVPREIVSTGRSCEFSRVL